MRRHELKSHCAVNFALEAVGDPWALLIVRDIAFDGKHSFNEFLASDERIARNILADRLVWLEQAGVLLKKDDPRDRRKGWYGLTEKGIDLIPVLFALSEWSFTYDPETAADGAFGEVYMQDRARITRLAQDAVRSGRSLFAGEDSLARQIFSQDQALVL
jgi:DNA-binding HxlR family transcriptional regulator